ncbi:DMT family transporter [Devosia sp. Naph2]|uniref:DMT family transporter n=1 Tax=Devosia polycyclovorans TaxID=3345148 RepID=UPI0035D07D7E
MTRSASLPALFVVAFGTGCLPTIMLFFNSELIGQGGPLLGSWIVHGTGTFAAIVLLLLLSRFRPADRAVPEGRPPLWAFLGGCTGAVNVMLSSTAVNAGLALSGTQAVALSGQMLFVLAADRWGFLGLPRRALVLAEMVPIGLIVAGSLVIIHFGSSLSP